MIVADFAVWLGGVAAVVLVLIGALVPFVGGVEDD